MTEKEFNHIILPLTKNIYAFALNMTGDKMWTADITQDVICRLWDIRNTLRKVENMKAYALKITRNICLDMLKKRQPLYCEEQVLQNGGHEDLMQQIENKNTAEAVRKIIDTLPANQKEVILLREIEELEYEEIAKITGLGLNNIRVLLARARSKVKEILIKKYQVSGFEN